MNLWSFIDEKTIVEKLLKNKKLINTDTNRYMVAYIKYLKQDGKTKTDIRNELDKLMLESYTGFVMADWDDKLQRYVNKYSKKANCDYKRKKRIIITNDEIEFIKNIGDVGGVKAIEIEKVLYCMLVLAKSTYRGEKNEDYWCNYDSRDIFRLARFKYKKRSSVQFIQRENLIYDLNNYKKDVFELGGKNIKLLYGDKQIKEDNIVIDIELDEQTAENMITDYLAVRNKENYSYCKVCGKEITQTTPNSPQKYCSKCKKEEWKKYNANKQKEYRNK